MNINSAASRFFLGATLLGLLHISSVIHAMLPDTPENRRNESVDMVLAGIEPETLQADQLRAFSAAYGIEPVALVVKEEATAKSEVLTDMNPKLIAMVTTLQTNKGKISLQRNGKDEFVDVRLGETLFEFTVTAIDEKTVRLVNGEQELLLEVFAKPKAVSGQ